MPPQASRTAPHHGYPWRVRVEERVEAMRRRMCVSAQALVRSACGHFGGSECDIVSASKTTTTTAWRVTSTSTAAATVTVTVTESAATAAGQRPPCCWRLCLLPGNQRECVWWNLAAVTLSRESTAVWAKSFFSFEWTNCEGFTHTNSLTCSLARSLALNS